MTVLENGFEACKRSLIEFESLQANFQQNAVLDEICVTRLAIIFSKARFVFSKFGRLVSMFEVLFQKLKSVSNEYCYNSTLLSVDSRLKFTTKVPLEYFTPAEQASILTTNYFVV